MRFTGENTCEGELRGSWRRAVETTGLGAVCSRRGEKGEDGESGGLRLQCRSEDVSARVMRNPKAQSRPSKELCISQKQGCLASLPAQAVAESSHGEHGHVRIKWGIRAPQLVRQFRPLQLGTQEVHMWGLVYSTCSVKACRYGSKQLPSLALLKATDIYSRSLQPGRHC